MAVKKKTDILSDKESEQKANLKELILGTFDEAKNGKNCIYIEKEIPLYVERRPAIMVKADRFNMARLDAESRAKEMFDKISETLKSVLGENFNNVGITQRFIKPYKKDKGQQYKILVEVSL